MANTTQGLSIAAQHDCLNPVISVCSDMKKATNACNAVAELYIMHLNNKPIAGTRDLISNFA